MELCLRHRTLLHSPRASRHDHDWLDATLPTTNVAKGSCIMKGLRRRLLLASTDQDGLGISLYLMACVNECVTCGTSCLSYLVDHPTFRTRRLDRAIGMLGRTLKDKSDSCICSNGCYLVVYLTTRSKVFAFGENALMVVDVVLPTMLCSDGINTLYV